MAISTRMWRSPVTRSAQSPSIVARPSSSRPSSAKKEIAASRDSTTMPTFSIRCSVTRPTLVLCRFDTLTGRAHRLTLRSRHDGFVVRSSPADVLEDPLARNPVVSGPIPVLSVLNAVERDGAFMEPSGRNRWKWSGRESGSDRRIALPWVATGCRGNAMVRRGSTVRVRQRASLYERVCGLIREDTFEEYAEELADDIGVIDRQASWHLCHIAWKAAAEHLKQDHTEVLHDD